MRVCHISTVHPETDIRIFFKECLSLKKKYDEVYLIVSSDKDKIINGINILSLPCKGGRVYRFFVKKFIAFKKALKVNADVYHFHDPELLFTGLLLKICGKKVIYDVHEDVPLQILNKSWLGPLWVRKMISGMFNFMEKGISSKFDGVVTVTQEIGEKFYKCKRVCIVRNLPVVKAIKNAEPAKSDNDHTVIIYAGEITEIRGIKKLIEAVNLLNGRVRLWLLGDWETQELCDECKKMDGWEYAVYYGRKKPEDVYGYLKSADIGMCTLYPRKNYLMSLPIKAFEYIACGLPIIMSDFPYWRKNFNNYAVFVDPEKPDEIAAAIDKIINSSDKGKQDKKCNFEFSWEEESKKLTALYDEILS